MRRQSGGAFEGSGDARAVRRGSAEKHKKVEELKPKIFEHLAKVFGNSESGGSGGHCPGKTCERLEGVGEADWTFQEQWEEAGAGCPRNCAAPLDSTIDGEESEIPDDEAGYVIEQIENISDLFHAGENPDLENYELWEWDLFVYWRRIERDFERNVQISLQKMVQMYLYPKS